MKRIALAMTLAALAAPASAFTSANTNDVSNDFTTLRSSEASQATETACFGPINAWWKQRMESFKKRQAGDQGGNGVDDAPRYRDQNDERKRNIPRRRHADPGDLGGRGPSLDSGGPGKK